MSGIRPNRSRVIRDVRPRLTGRALLLVLAAGSAIQAAQPADLHRIRLNAGALQTDSPAAIRLGAAAIQSFSGKRLHLIQFSGPIQPKNYQMLGALGFRVVSYLPENAYLVYGDYQAVAGLRSLRGEFDVQWDAPFLGSHKLQPGAQRVLQSLKGQATKDGLGLPQAYSIQLVEDTAVNANTLKAIEGVSLGKVQQDYKILGYRNLVVNLPAASLEALAQHPDVVTIDAWTAPRKQGETQNMIISGNLTTGTGTAVPSGPGYLAWLTAKGFTQGQFDTSDFAVDLSDSGVDNGTPSPNHFGLHRSGDVGEASRILYNRLQGTPNTGSTIQGCDGHGNLNSHIISGYNNYSYATQVDASGYHYGLGVNPFIKVGSSVVFDPNNFTSPSYPNLMAEAYRDKARINSNSWGANTSSYTTDCQAYDALVRDAQPTGSTVPANGNQEMVIVFSAGNAGAGAGTIGSPGSAKNVITVGASEDVNPFGGADGCAVGDTGADNAMDLIDFSSRGPTADGRKKPDIVAPGTHVSGGVFQSVAVNPTTTSTGSASACFDATGVCAGPGGSKFFPTATQWFTASSGTSHSCPAVAGAASLTRQYFINRGWAVPSPAMTKAFLMNSARYMTGLYTNDSLYSNNQGMGLLDMGQGFDGVSRVLWDQRPADLFTTTGEARVLTGTIQDSGKPFRVTLAWTDAPGSTAAAAYCNDLDLTVYVGGQAYKGNVFTGSASVTGGAADAKNNVESVFLPAGVSGDFTVVVRAANINSIGVPNGTGLPNQDFALVAYNATEVPRPYAVLESATLVSESCAPANLGPDPGEVVTYRFAFRNAGSADIADLNVTLAATGGATSPTGPLSLGPVTAGSTVQGNISFQVDPAKSCSDVLDLTLQMQDGTTDLGSSATSLQMGSTTVSNWSSGAVVAAIPDNSTTGVLVPLVISDPGLVHDLRVKVRLDHTYDSDLTLSLIAPDGTTVALASGVGGSGNNFGSGATDCTGTKTEFSDSASTPVSSGSAPFTGAYTPASPLSALDGKTLAGTWNLKVVDTANADTGTVYCFQLETVTLNCSSCVASAPVISSFSPTSAARGASVVLQGTGFSGASLVRFNGVQAAFQVNSDTQITATVPGGSSSGTLSVTTPAGTGTSSGSFTLLPSVAMGAKPAAILTGKSYTFTATVQDGADTSLTWSATAGSPSTGSGASFPWTAPATAGSATITATSTAYTVSDSATLAVKTTDLDGSGLTEVSDLSRLSRAFTSSTGDPLFSAEVDLNGDGTIDDTDATTWLDEF